jgi:hypothetical protein
VRNWGGIEYWFVMGKIFSKFQLQSMEMMSSFFLQVSIREWYIMQVIACFMFIRHEANLYSDAVESDIYVSFSFAVFNKNPTKVRSLEAMSHPRCVGWGEIGLDYHYDHSPRDVQRAVFTRQLKLAVKLGKPLTIHTREAEDDTEQIRKLELPKDHKVLYLLPCIVVSSDIIFRFIFIVSPIRRHLHNVYWNISQTFTSGSQAGYCTCLKAKKV